MTMQHRIVCNMSDSGRKRKSGAESSEESQPKRARFEDSKVRDDCCRPPPLRARAAPSISLTRACSCASGGGGRRGGRER